MIHATRSSRDRAARVALDMIAGLTPRAAHESPRLSIGVLPFWGIGDAVLTTPFLRALRSAHPQSRLIAIGKPWLPELFGSGSLERFMDAVETAPIAALVDSALAKISAARAATGNVA